MEQVPSRVPLENQKTPPVNLSTATCDQRARQCLSLPACSQAPGLYAGGVVVVPRWASFLTKKWVHFLGLLRFFIKRSDVVMVMGESYLEKVETAASRNL